MAAFAWLFEKRPLKRPRLGPPDVYPQDPKQKEDELTAVNVKQGFTSTPHIADEYGSARNANITAAKFGAFFSAILTKKQELNTFQDSGRKRQQINPKDNFWPVTARSKNAIEAWFKDLAGSKPLTSLAKKVPISNKKEEIFMTLYEFSVPTMRAAWFIKMSSAHTVAISEAKIKKRQLPDPSQEWTQALCKFLREQLQKLAEHYHSSIALGSASNTTTTSMGSGSNSNVIGSSSTGSNSLNVSVDVAYKHWQYICQLARHLFEEGLLDRQDFLLWILELLEKTKCPDDPIMKLIMPLVLQYVDEFVHSELLSRRLAHHCARKLNQLISEYHANSSRCQSPLMNTSNGFSMSPTPTQTSFNPLTASIAEFLGCSHHRSIVLGLSAVIQIRAELRQAEQQIQQRGRAAEVRWSCDKWQQTAAAYFSFLHNIFNIRAELRQAEQQIQQRGRAAEVRWSCDKWQQTAAGATIQRVLNALDTLDRHFFNKVDVGNSLDTLYAKIFPAVSERDQNLTGVNTVAEILIQDEPIVRLLCEWAVTTKRSGDHRALVVAKLLEKRQSDLASEQKYTDTELADEKDSQDSTGLGPLGIPFYQNLLVSFLDTQAPVIDEKSSSGNRTAFSNLVLLFAELIRHDVFSHDAYMCKLVSRGSFSSTTNQQVATVPNNIQTVNKPLFMHEPSLTGFMHDPSRGLSPAPGSAGYIGMTSLSIAGLNDSSRPPEPLPMFEPPDHRPESIKHENAVIVLDEKSSSGNRTAFSNLVLLFAELIRHDVFSHDAYMCKLVSRGSFSSTTNQQVATVPNNIQTVNKPLFMHEPSLTGFMHDPSRGLSPAPGSAGYIGMTSLSIAGLNDSSRPPEPLPMFEPPDHRPESIKHEIPWDAHMDMDDARIDADLDKLLQNIKEGQQNMTDQPDILLPDSVGSDKDDMNPLNASTPLAHPPLVPSCPSVGDGVLGGIGSSSSSSNGGGSTTVNSTFRHLLYTTHFPLPQDESSYHDCNQRHILLFGVGKARDEARHVVKKVTKEIMKLFSKKTCMDIADGAKIKKHAKEGFSFDSVVARFQSLSYFDQHVVTLSCASSVVEMLNSFALGNSSYLPLVEYISFLFELMETALNIHGLIEFTIQLLRELVEVENQLSQKGSIVAGSYATSLGLFIVGVLYKYHCCLLVSQEQTCALFEGLCKITKHVSDPADCSSAERCILCYLYDLYACCSFLRTKYSELFGLVNPKIEEALYVSHEPSALNLLWNTTYMIDYINNPRMKVDPQQIKQLNENASSRYSFVCNAVHSISDARDADRLNEISVLCAELTANCNALSAEWLGVLRALCCSSNHGCGFIDVLTQVDVGDLSIHDNLAVFTSILVARRCFSLQDFVVHVALPSLRSACPAGGVDQDAESGARLTCHLLLRLLKTVEINCVSYLLPSGPVYHLGTSPGPLLASNTARPMYLIKSPCDRQLLSAAHNRMLVEVVLAVLKGILELISDSNSEGSETKARTDITQNKGELSIKDILGPIDDADFDLSMPTSLGRPAGSGISGGSCGMETAGLSEFAKHVLRQICSQEWIRELCLRDPDLLCSQDLSVNSVLSPQQARQLLQMICHPKVEINIGNEDSVDQRQMITNILQNLDLWTLQVSWLELQLMYQHVLRNENAQSPNDVNGWLETVARATIDVFQLISEENAGKICNNGVGDPVISTSKSNHRDSDKPERIWLIAPLIAKLPAAVQGKVLRAAGQVLESGSWSSASSSWSSSSSKNKDKDKQVQKSSSLLSHQPFLSLVLMCLKGQDEQREGLLNSLYSQLSQCLHIAKDDKHGAEDIKMKQSMQEALQLRLSLVGGMFDMIQKNSSQTTEWAVLLVQLISYGVVDPQTNYLGLQVAETQKVSPWDLLEGHKNPAPLSWAWFGAVRLERKPLRQEEGHRLLLWHTHSLKKSSSYYLDPPPLPPEDLDPCPEKQLPPVCLVEEIKRGRETPSEQSPRGGAKKPKTQRRRRQAKMPNGQPTHAIRPGIGFPDQLMAYPQPTHQPWYGQQPPMQQPAYYSPQQPLPPAGRFERPMSQSKAALSSMLRSRNPSAQFLPGHTGNHQHQSGGTPAVSMQGGLPPGHPGAPRHPGGHPGSTGPNPYQSMEMLQKQQMMLRQQLRPQGMAGGTNFSHTMPGQTAPLHHLPPQANVSQTYGNYNGTPMQQNTSMIETRNQGMMQQGFNQTYVNPQTRAGMIAPTGQQGQYIPQTTRLDRPQYTMNQGGMQAPNVTVGQMAGGMGGVTGANSHISVSGSPMVQGGANTYGGAAGNPTLTTGQAQMQHMQQIRHQHQQQLLAMQKQQQQQQQQQQTVTLVPHLQRHMANPNQGPHAPPQQHHQFHQPY
ncbi:mediator of RNA polymerase II transcription subunit 12-like protein [Centruroides sculpturatus]|uniref:mediator of RNA polymerase II transcription subunit 12-like protein n=1 Tax=Centruroides sculpturatus TaxID=218467 RepID=UPI000C6E4A1F|nr:mediator of RNA polymerase II transcription subunit 12-like protein [Centruroides sculpturatus]